jgi:hypothetical protein
LGLLTPGRTFDAAAGVNLGLASVNDFFRILLSLGSSFRVSDTEGYRSHYSLNLSF